MESKERRSMRVVGAHQKEKVGGHRVSTGAVLA